MSPSAMRGNAVALPATVLAATGTVQADLAAVPVAHDPQGPRFRAVRRPDAPRGS
jgi:hypothetical protein